MITRALRLGTLLVGLIAALHSQAATEPPLEWIDADTGHRIVRISRTPGTASLYFHQDTFTLDGTRTLVTSPEGLATLHLTTGELKVIAPGVHPTGSVGAEVGSRTGQVYYFHEGALFVVNPDTLQRRMIARLPEHNLMSDINADETLMVGAYTENGVKVNTWPPPGTVMHGPNGQVLTHAEMREVLINQRLEMGVPMELFTINLQTGERKVVKKSTNWLGHIQFSPTDPNLIMYCHEGNWHKVDRIWTVRTDGTEITKIHTRMMNMEIAGHEFFGGDGKMIWYDLQTPRGEDFWLAGYELATGKRTWYHMERNEWSVHFNVSPDGTLFAGDGGDSEMVAHAPDGKWIYLYRGEGIPDVAGISAPDSESLVQPGVLRSQRLVNMANHDYRLEPNIHFTPDMKWLVFRSNMHGDTHTYKVEIAPAR